MVRLQLLCGDKRNEVSNDPERRVRLCIKKVEYVYDTPLYIIRCSLLKSLTLYCFFELLRLMLSNAYTTKIGSSLSNRVSVVTSPPCHPSLTSFGILTQAAQIASAAAAIPIPKYSADRYPLTESVP